MRFCAGYMIGVCGLYMYSAYMCAKIWYGLETIGVCATVLTAETGKRMTGLLALASGDTDSHRYWRLLADT